MTSRRHWACVCECECAPMISPWPPLRSTHYIYIYLLFQTNIPTTSLPQQFPKWFTRPLLSHLLCCTRKCWVCISGSFQRCQIENNGVIAVTLMPEWQNDCWKMVISKLNYRRGVAVKLNIQGQHVNEYSKNTGLRSKLYLHAHTF